jgi:hypothetical protein
MMVTGKYSHVYRNNDMKNDPVYHESYVGFHHPILPDCGVCKLQYISCDWNNVPNDIPGAWPP